MELTAAMDPVRVVVEAVDAFTVAGLVNQLSGRPEVRVVPRGELTGRGALLVAVDRMSGQELALLGGTGAPKVLVTDHLREDSLRTAVDCQVVAVLSRAEVTGERLAAELVTAANGTGAMPADTLDALLDRVTGRTRQPHLSPREVEVLRLIAEGLDTPDIASRLCYSERTVKNVLYSLTSRLQLRNRPHAVAFAVRAGLI
jgi:DNA-binding NarL/FixJ family response regulator